MGNILLAKPIFATSGYACHPRQKVLQSSSALLGHLEHSYKQNEEKQPVLEWFLAIFYKATLCSTVEIANHIQKKLSKFSDALQSNLSFSRKENSAIGHFYKPFIASSSY
jgi:hypothetical protein